MKIANRYDVVLLVLIVCVALGVRARFELSSHLFKEIVAHEKSSHTLDFDPVLDKHIKIGMGKSTVISFFNNMGFNTYPVKQDAKTDAHYVAHKFYGWWLFGTIYRAHLTFENGKLINFHSTISSEST